MGASLRYADAGVDIDRANSLVETIKTIAKDTHRPGVMGEIGGFGGLFSLNVGAMERPVLVSSTDGVGTKLKIAFMTGRHDTVGIDLVAMSVNDIVVQGAKPLFFLDYLSMGRLSTEVATDIIRGVGEGCRQAECALIGGETAEMPGLYAEGEYDLAGFAVGVVDNDKIIDGSEIGVGHRLIGIASSGLHSNGYSLVRKICFEMLGLEPDTHMPELGCSLADELLTPTKIYVRTIHSLCRDLPVHGLVHVTGGGFTDNIARVLPHACSARLYDGSWDVPPIFGFLQRSGDIAPQEMLRTFNLGIGMIVVVPREAESDVLLRLSGMNEAAFVIGEVVERQTSAARIQWT